MPPAAFPAPGEPDTIFVVDLSSMVRARWGAIKPPPDDVHDLQVVISMCQWIRILIAEVQPARVVFAADAPGPTWHRDLWPAFHGKRTPPGPGYDAQLARVEQILRLHNLPILAAPGFLADDVIAAVVQRARNERLRVVVVSRDHDLWALIDEDGKVICWDGTEKGLPIGPMEVVKRYGVLPGQIADFKALTGEDDEAPGVPTIGEKTAAILLGRFGTLPEVLRKWQWETKGVNQKQRDALRLGGEVALLSRELVGLRNDAPLGDFGTDDAIVEWSEADAAAIRAMGEELDIGILRQAGRKRPLVDRHQPLEDFVAEVREQVLAHEPGEEPDLPPDIERGGLDELVERVSTALWPAPLLLNDLVQLISNKMGIAPVDVRRMITSDLIGGGVLVTAHGRVTMAQRAPELEDFAPPWVDEQLQVIDDPERIAIAGADHQEGTDEEAFQAAVAWVNGEMMTPVRAAPVQVFSTDPLLLTSDHVEQSFAAGLCPLCGMTMGPGLCERKGAELVCRGRARKTAAFEVVPLFGAVDLDGPALTITGIAVKGGEERSLGDLAAETQARIRAGVEEHLGLEADDGEDDEGFRVPPDVEAITAESYQAFLVELGGKVEEMKDQLGAILGDHPDDAGVDDDEEETPEAVPPAPEEPAIAEDAGGPDPAPAGEDRPPCDGDPTELVHGGVSPWKMTACGLVVADGIRLYSNEEGITCPACAERRPFQGQSFGLWAAPPTNISAARLRAGVMDVLTFGGRGGWSGFPTGPKALHALSIAKMLGEVLGFDFCGAPFEALQTWVEAVGDQLVVEGWAAKTHSDDAHQRAVCGPLYTRIPNITREEILDLARLNPEAVSKGEMRVAAAVPPHVQLPDDFGLLFILDGIVDAEAPLPFEALIAKGIDGDGFLEIGEDTTWPEDMVRAFVAGMIETHRITVNVEGIVQARPKPETRGHRSLALPPLAVGPTVTPSLSMDCVGSSRLRPRGKARKPSATAMLLAAGADPWIDLPNHVANLETGQILAKPDEDPYAEIPWQQLVRWSSGDRLKLWSLPVWQHKVTLGAPVLLTPIAPDAPPVVAVFEMTEDLPRHLTRVDPVRDSEARLYVGGAIVGLAKIPHAMIERYLLAGDPLLSTLPTKER